MSSSEPSIAGYLLYLRRRGLPRPAPPHPPTSEETLVLSLLLSAVLASPAQPPRRRQRGDPRARQQMLSTIADLDRRIDLYEDPSLHALALKLIPLDKLSSEARLAPDARGEARWGGYEDELALGLVRWFKADFMKWVDPILCSQCGTKTDSRGGTDPTAEERDQGGAGRVELWECGSCHAVERFPRFNDLKTLMRTRRGRCGEFSNLFMLFLRAVGLRARYVWNAEDHVWNEYFSATLNRWVHVDPSEGKTNQPLLYSVGWGKAMTYILSFGVTGARDTTLAYHLSASLPKGRTRISERDLKRALKEVTERRMAKVSGGEAERERLRDEKREEDRWEADVEGRTREEQEREERESGGGLEGRVSGTDEWRTSRGEKGGEAQSKEDKLQTPRSPPIFDLSSSDSSTNLLHFGSSTISPPTISISTASPTILLTPSSPSTTGASYIPIPLSLTSSFLTTFTFRISRPSPSSPGADGLAFIYSLSFPQIGEGGGSLGYGGLGPGWAVEVDTYRTEDRTADPPTPHVSVHAPLDPHHRNSLACTSDPGQLPRLTDGKWYEMRVQWRADTKRIGVWLSEPTTGEENEGRWEWLFGATIPESRLSGGDDEAWLGVSAACGGLSETHEIGEWKLWLLDGDE